MTANRLLITIEATQLALEERLDEATHGEVRLSRPREGRARVDAFLSSTSRHLAAVEEVLVPAARRELPDGDRRAGEYLHQARALELALATLKARVYGAVAATHIPWAEVWYDVRRELARHNELERALVGNLVIVGDDSSHEATHDELADRLYRAELKAPTRAHPYLPHRGPLGVVARRVWAVADRFWDTTEDRTVPQPVRPPSKEHAHDSLVVQYLTGEPRLDAAAPLFAHRRRR